MKPEAKAHNAQGKTTAGPTSAADAQAVDGAEKATATNKATAAIDAARNHHRFGNRGTARREKSAGTMTSV
jgi:hypothetical protein